MSNLKHQLLIMGAPSGEGLYLGEKPEKHVKKQRGPTLLGLAQKQLKGQKFGGKEERMLAVRQKMDELKTGGYSFSDFLSNAKDVAKVALDLGKKGLEFYEKNPKEVQKYAKSALDMLQSRSSARAKRGEGVLETREEAVKKLMKKYTKLQLAELLAMQ